MKIFETAYCDSGLLWEDVAKRYLAYRFDNVREIANYHCSVNQEVNFTGPINGTGWYGAEPWGRWSDGPRSTIVFRLDGGACRDMSLIGRAKAFLPVADLVQEVTVRANGEEMAR